MSKVAVYPFDIRIEVIREGFRSRRYGTPEAIKCVGGVPVAHEPLVIDDSLLGREVTPRMTDLDLRKLDMGPGVLKHPRKRGPKPSGPTERGIRGG